MPGSATSSRVTCSRCRWRNRSLEDVHKGFNQLWRRNIRRPRRPASRSSRAATRSWPSAAAVRDHGGARPLPPAPARLLPAHVDALNSEDPNRMRLYFARHEGENVAAATMLIVGGHVWYSYGASANHKREVRPSNAMQWRMLRDAYAMGATVYDCAVSPTRWTRPTTLRPDPVQGRHRRAGGGVPGRVGLPLNKLLHKALDIYMSRR
ncbi:GNAT family N-acetyltransferase [Streptomyces sp. AC1-42W]|uniref:GNAT family N-acetyltransferase n=1 Tax=Streptomyces sp. AC1-42W TaxID=2218666 RepID=UPI001F53E66A|nr:GNAT family N-acetyltransferase [Streptomyces sp. AC1-42W]